MSFSGAKPRNSLWINTLSQICNSAADARRLPGWLVGWVGWLVGCKTPMCPLGPGKISGQVSILFSWDSKDAWPRFSLPVNTLEISRAAHVPRRSREGRITRIRRSRSRSRIRDLRPEVQIHICMGFIPQNLVAFLMFKKRVLKKKNFFQKDGLTRLPTNTRK